jgi:alpha-glucosidase
MNKQLSIYLLTMALVTGNNVAAQVKAVVKINSPAKQTQLELGLQQDGRLQYRVRHLGAEMVSWSDLGLEVKEIKPGRTTISKLLPQKTHLEQIPWPIGENDLIENNYREQELFCRSGELNYSLLIRVFDGSTAFRYLLPGQSGLQNLQISKELTRFNLGKPYRIYQYHHESVFSPVWTDSLKTTSDLPSTLSNGKNYLSIGEADNSNYTKAELGMGPDANGLSIVFARDVAVTATLPFKTPWRTITFSGSAIGLHKYSELSLKLASQPYAKVPEWIRPGKLIRSGLTTQSGLDCIDMAKKLNFSYIMFDAGWYGPERALTSDPAIVIPQIDMTRVIAYGKENGIGVILYINHLGLQNHLDKILPIYKKWGVSGLKFGFIDGFTQKGLSWLSAAIKKVNDAGLFINIHDNYKPTGLSRTYPALLAQEGIRGDENSPDAYHTTVLPFTRFLAGAADFTFCFPNSKSDFSRNLKVSKAQQLALTVVYFSPLQAIFWYGAPKDYTNLEELEFFKYVPTTWNQSLYLKGEIGQNISVARRKGDTWFVGNAAGLTDWKDEIRFDFLSPGKSYTASIYEDTAESGISRRDIPVKKGDSLPFEVKAKGGMAMIIRVL